MDVFQAFRALPFFKDVDDQDIQTLAQYALLRKHEAGQRIISQKENKRSFHVVLSGQVKIFKTNASGKEQTLYLVEEGQPFCLCTAFAEQPSPVNAEALILSQVASVPALQLEELAKREPQFMLKMVQTLSNRLLEAMDMVESLALRGIQERVASFLLHAESRESTSPGQAFRLPVSHREMAKIVGTTPETVSRVIQKFNREGIIHTTGRTITIHDHHALRF